MPDTLPLSIQLSWLIPLYGFSGMLLSLPWAAGWVKRNGPRPAAYLNLLVTLLAVLHGSLVLRAVLALGPQHLDIAWFSAADLDLRIGFDLSLTNLAALELVTGLSLVGQVFALGYLDKEWSLARFYALVGFFEGAMAGVVLSSNLFMSYFLLEMLTLSTYLLVGFWYAQPLVVTAARDAFLTKRVGDVLLLMGVVTLSAWAGSLEFNDLYAWSANETLPALGATLLGLALIAGPMGKCAQFPMHLWLDEAMEGPNPASILRNSVVVTCGAVVLLKVMPLLLISPVAIDVLLAVGTISALGGALVAISQVDLKRACSYSTTSYLGLVFIAIALQQPFIALLLLFSHALAKAVLFMSVGSVIATTNCQDLTELGGLGTRMPATTTGFLVGAAGLTGLLPLGCFWSFGLMLEGLGSRAPFFAAVVLLTNALTALNLTRVYRQVFLGAPHPKTRRTPEVNWLMALPMVTVAVLVLVTPLVMARIDRVPGIGAFSGGTALVLVGSGLGGLLVGSLVPLDTFWSRSVLRPLRVLQDLLAFDFYTDRIYRATIVAFVAGLARITNGFDQLVVNGMVNRIAAVSMGSAESLKLGVSGRLQTYVFTVVAAIVLLVGSLSWLGS
ncbi:MULTISPECIES: NAD(P)H-quinone oxidoreductase subunit F [Cyanophyceae]|uniref:NAD(P)H-quinone oxidoreductase subunit F n=1 Tax=Aphanothece cf. minutissima CCALA 015 TaxID=2107695 RepID=A0ABX5F779_9CHRO|nr:MULTISPECIES: NAD(P)H-quinone oxidoreductase subunit F [Cyanophyceae]MCP9798978.1 NAD(P)H-quinone oxidoreductase subunit F [Cyanobium sp. Lug-B]MCP9932517.1 NAD(P)H-quinone oxidoreductase subunit F [Cyanobium sp. Candia 9D4]PSB37312.1 NAD(P)H-quinone oxidoreductase subunit F [Aphanothece cf. minutissima CCALA 015]